MQDILEQYQHELEGDDLLVFWEQELSLRTILRNTALTTPIMVDNEEQLNLLYRSLYFSGRKFDFFKILFSNLHYMSVLQWLVSAPAEIMQDFLHFLPWYILNIRVKPVELEFIPRIYRETYRADFIPVVNVLDEGSCVHLISRTANPDLRQLLKEQQIKLKQLHRESCYGLEENNRTSDYPTLYGDKVHLIRDTLKLLHDSSPDHFPEPYAASRFLLQLEAAELVFKCGLVEDSLAFLLDIYSDYQQKNRLVEIISDQKIYKGLYQLLRAVIPIYSLIYEPLQAYNCACQLYNKYFPLISPEAAPLQYLKLWEVILPGYKKESSRILSEVLYTAKKIGELRPAELPLLVDEELETGISPKRLGELFKSIEEKLLTLPHEAFITMELIRLLEFNGVLKLDGEMAAGLMGNYITMWKWLPCRIFMHSDLLNQIAPLVDDNSRYQAQRIIDLTHTMNNDLMKSEIASRPQLFRKKGENIRRNILAGKFMGAL
jgi:hypothetical protein